MTLGKSGQLAESGEIGHRKIGQNFSVQLHAPGFEPLYQLAVIETVQARCSVDANNPKTSEFPFPHPPVSVRKTKSPLNGLARRTVEFSPSSYITFSQFHDFLPAAPGFGSSFNSWQVCSSLSQKYSMIF
jgi:hypothetical protein